MISFDITSRVRYYTVFYGKNKSGEESDEEPSEEAKWNSP